MPHKSARFFPALVTILVMLSLPGASLAQDDSLVAAPHKPIAPKAAIPAFESDPKELRSMVGGPWMLDPNMKATLYLRNSLETASLETTPILYLSNGKKITLPAVTLAPAATVIVSIGDALLRQGIAPYANLTGYVELDYLASYDPLCATVVSVDMVHSVVFTYSFRPTAPAAITLKAMGQPPPDNTSKDQRIDGVWWKQSAKVTGFVSLSNTTDQNIAARFTVDGADDALLNTYQVSLPPRATTKFNLAEIASSGPLASGGITLAYHAPVDSILVSGGLEDIATGYSATMAFRPHNLSMEKPSQKTAVLTELGLMVGAQDPMMLFPPATEFTPFSVIRNVSSKSVSLTPEVFWMEQGKMHRQQLSAVQLQAMQTRMLDAPSLLTEAGLSEYNGMLNLTFKTTASPNALLLTSGSVDQTGTYVFQVLPHQSRESMAKSLAYWSTGNGDDTMVTVWNPADEAQEFLFTVRYEGGSYVMPIHLEARETRFFNIASLIQDQIPDAYGHVIPKTTTSGSARLTGTHADNEVILVDLDAGIYNVNKATCIYSCTSCDGAISALIGEPVDFSMGTHKQLSFMLKQDTGYTYDYSSQGTWSSSATNVATIASAGMATSVSVGSFTGSASISEVPIYDSDYCAYNVSCPDEGFMSGSGGGTVNNLNITITNSSPITFGGSGPIVITGTGFTSASLQSITVPGVQINNPVVNSATSISAQYVSSCSATVGSSANGLIATFSLDGTSPTAAGPYSIVLPAIPAPIVQFNGSNISGTQSAVAGQQIALTAVAPTLPNCVTFYNPNTGAQSFAPQWGTPSGSATGGYAASVASGKITPLPATTTNTSYTFYWPYPGNGYQETVKYYFAAWAYGGWSPSTTAAFNIKGPSSPAMTAPVGPVEVNTNSAPTRLSLGNYPNLPLGIGFTASSNTAGLPAGTYSFVQLISASNVTATINGSPCSYSNGTGLDNTYPYDSGTSSTNDNPSTVLYADDSERKETFGATMYLLWQAQLTNSIPVPLGYVVWGWAGDAVNTSGVWKLRAGVTNAGYSNGFVVSTTYPQWTTHVSNAPAPCQ